MLDPDDLDKDGGETFIDPNDLNIISNDYNWEPNDDDVVNYANQLGFDIENDPQEFLEIAYNYLKKPLPKGWKRAFQKENGELLYIDMSTNEIHLSTQLEEMAKEEYLLNKKEYEQRQRAEEEAKKKVTVIPRTKIPPIGAKKPKENQNQIKEKEFIQKLAKEKQKEDMIKQNEEIKVIKSQIERKKSDNENNNNAAESGGLSIIKPNANVSEDNDQYHYPSRVNKDENCVLNNNYNKNQLQFEEESDDDNEDNNNKKKKKKKENDDDDEYAVYNPNRKRKHCYQPEVYEDLNAINQSNKYKKEKEEEEQNDHHLHLSTPEKGKDKDEYEEYKDKDKGNQSSFVSVSPNAYATPEKTKKIIEENDKPKNNQKQSPHKSFNNDDENDKHIQNIVIEEQPKDTSLQKEIYLKRKHDEFFQYKTKLQSENEATKENMNQKYLERYEQMFLKEKRSIKDSFNIKKETKELNSHYESIFTKEIDDYKNQISKRQLDSHNQSTHVEKCERELNELRRKKDDLLNSIQIQKENNKIQRNRRKERMKEQIQKEKFISDERIKIQKDSLFQKSIANISTIEMRYDNQLRLQKDQINLNASQSMSFGKFIKAPISIIDPNQYDAILKEHERFLEESYQVKKIEVEKEFLKTRDKDLDEQKQMSLNETQDRIAFVNKEMSELEKEYYNELNAIRSKAKMLNNKNAKMTSDQLNGLSNSFDQIKSTQANTMDSTIGEIINSFLEIIRLSQGSDIIHSSESKCEEVLMLKIGEANVQYQKAKTLYSMTERDFKQKHILLMYFYEIANYLSKRLIERPLLTSQTQSLSQSQGILSEDISREQTEELIKVLFDFGRGIMNKYHNKYLVSLSTDLFPLIDSNCSIGTGSNNNQNSYTQLMFGDRSIVMNNNQYRSEGALTKLSFEADTETIRSPNTNMNINPNDKRAFSSDPIRAFPIDSNREVYSERYPNFAMSQHDIIKESEEDYTQVNKSANYNKRDNEMIMNTTKTHHIAQSQELAKSQKYPSALFQSKFDSPSIPTIPEEIKEKLSDEDFLLYSKINDFLQSEETTLLKLETEIGNKRTVFDELTQFNDKGYLLQISHEIIKEKNVILNEEKEFKDKANQYAIIKTLISNSFNFISANSSRTNIIKDKLMLIIKHIEEYYNPNLRKSDYMEKSNVSYRYNQDNEQNEPHTVCICNSKSSHNFFKKNPPQEPINIGTIHNQFTNFYSLYRPNTLAHKINTNFSHEFFNFKKNSEYVNYKLASTRQLGINDILRRRNYI